MNFHQFIHALGFRIAMTDGVYLALRKVEQIIIALPERPATEAEVRAAAVDGHKNIKVDTN